MSNLIPTIIVDRNGRTVTVYRKPPKDAAPSRLRMVDAPSYAIQPQDFLKNGVVTRAEASYLRHQSHLLAKMLSEATGWKIYAVGSDINNERVKGTYMPPDANWGYMTVRTPDGLFVDIMGVRTEDQVIIAESNSLTRDRLLEVRPRDYKHLTAENELWSSDLDINIAASKVYKEISGFKLNDWRLTVSDVDTITADGESIPIAADTHSPFACPKCGVFYSAGREETAWERSYEMRCQSCGEDTHVEEVECAVLPSSAKFEDVQTVRDTPWYHVSVRQNWVGDIRSGDADVVVHLGTEEAAMDRFKHLSKNGADIYMYEVRLADGIEIAPSIFKDSNGSQPQTTQDMKDEGMAADGATHYLNRYESAGSISLMASPMAFEVVSSKKLR